MIVRITRLSHENKETFGLIRDGCVATREEMTYQTGVPLPQGVREFLFDGWFEEIKDRLDGLPYGRSLSEFRILAPVDRPPKIICLAFNYPEHARRQDVVPSEDPVIIIKPRTALCGYGDEILCPGFVRRLDYEIELAIVIGRDCKDVGVQEAAEAIFGYTILNDVSARDIQFRDGQFTRAKGFDTFAPCGPWITTSDAVPDPDDLRLTTKINGATRQDSSTRKMHIKPPEIISRLSRSMTLERGDIISTGTPYGAVLNRPDLEYLKDGDKIEMEISGLGVLRNSVRMT